MSPSGLPQEPKTPGMLKEVSEISYHGTVTQIMEHDGIHTNYMISNPKDWPALLKKVKFFKHPGTPLVTISYKILLQEIPTQKHEWDDTVLNDLHNRSKEILKKMVLAGSISFPRAFLKEDMDLRDIML